MKFIPPFVLLALIALLCTNAFALDLRTNPAGQTLATELRNASPEENSTITGVLKIHSSTNSAEIPVKAEVVMEGNKWKTTYTTTATNRWPAIKVVIIHATNEPNQYLYGRAKDLDSPAPEPSPILNSAASETSLAGSDFTLADLGLEFLHWPEQKRLTGELRLGRDCYLLESRDARAREMVRVKSWVDKETKGVLVAEGYNNKDELVKKFSLSGSSFKKVNGHWQLEKMTIYSPKTKSETVLQFDLHKEAQ